MSVLLLVLQNPQWDLHGKNHKNIISLDYWMFCYEGNSHQEVVVLHAEGELLHVDVVDGAVGRAQEEEGAGSVVRRDRGQFL